MSPGHDRVVMIKSQIFFYCQSLVLSGFLNWSTRGCNMAAHSSIHASFKLRRWLTKFQLPKILLRPENIVQKFFWYTGMRPVFHTDRNQHHTHCSRTFVSPNWIPPGIYSWQPETLPACPPFISSSSFTWINPLKASSCWSDSTNPFPARVVYSCPSVLLHLSDGHNCITRCWL